MPGCVIGCGSTVAPLVQRGDSMAGPCWGDCEAPLHPSGLSAARCQDCTPALSKAGPPALEHRGKAAHTAFSEFWPSGHRTSVTLHPFLSLPGWTQPTFVLLPGAAAAQCLGSQGVLPHPITQPTFVLSPSAAAQYDSGVTPHPFLSLPGQKQRTQAKKIWPSGHRTGVTPPTR